MIMIEDFKKDINNSLKEIKNMGKQLEIFKEENNNPLKNFRKTQSNSKGNEQNHPGSKKGTRNNNEITK